MLPSTSLFSSSPSVAPHAPQGLPGPLASPARLPGLPLLAPDRRLALDYINLNALFIHPRINSHPSEPLRGSIPLLINHGARAGRPGCPSAWPGTRGTVVAGAQWSRTAGSPPTPPAASGQFLGLDPPSARGGLVGVRRTHQEPQGKRSW